MDQLYAERFDSSQSSEHRPFISVAIPTFRRPEMVRRAIESVLQQEHADWEMVISDDEGPEGATWSILSEHARSDPPHSRYREPPRPGPG